MTINRSLALVLALIAGIIGAFIARAVPRDAPNLQSITNALPGSSGTAPVNNECNAERAEIASTKIQIAVCLARSMQAQDTIPSDVSESSASDAKEFESPEIKRNRELLESDSEAVIVRRTDGTIGIYKSEEWPTDGDGLIIGRKFPDGSFGWYSRPVAGTERRPMFLGTSIWLKPDGTLMQLGKPARPYVIRMLGGKVDEPAEP